MKRSVNKLDELEQKKYWTVSTQAAWVAYSGLCAAIVLQMMFGADGKQIGGELAVLGLLCVTMLVGYLKNGIWDCTQTFSAKKNALLSAVASTAMALAVGVRSYFRYHKLLGSIATAAFVFITVFILCMVTIQLVWILYQKKRTQQEKQLEDEEKVEK